ncbi:hypothetical protein [Microbacterium sp. MEJ108Y]|uniref:hypothetical protein n=1 Tax=Microbacterium sp. MEJ108Y TaxID=1587523 RepID=UPI0012E08DB4|nr:hypothetical protein [Microbacterium sp. MEJ108Y]
MTITHDEIGSDEDLAREVLVVARDIAPCIFSFDADSEDRANAISILKRVFKSAAARGSHLVKGQRIGSAAVDYSDIQSAFEGQPTRALRALCNASRTTAGHSAASFPAGGIVAQLWPERYGS